MDAWPEARAVDGFLRRMRSRLVVLRVLEGAAGGCGLAALLAVSGVRSPELAMTTVLAVTLLRVALGDEWRWGWWRPLPRIASRVERRTTIGRNLLYTAAELPRTEREYVHEVVMQRAAGVARQLDPARLFPVRQAIVLMAVGVLALAASRLKSAEIVRLVERVPGVSAGPAVHQLDVTVTPPSYTGLPRTTHSNPSRLEVLANSRVDVKVVATASSVHIETLAGSQDMGELPDGFRGSITADADGFLAVEPRDSIGNRGPRMLVGLAVTPDRAPRVTLASPGRDLFFSVVPADLPVSITADDDLALASLELRYTAVSGSGERFTFVEHTLPLSITRTSARSWSASGRWPLAQLDLAPGDLIVYRAVATDRRPGAPPVESESYVIEMVTPGAIAAEGFAADDQRDRYAVSQQMVILKTERLLARRRSLPPDSVTEASRLLAAEQRQVRAEFVFMMGGELEDADAEMSGTLDVNEVAEAEAEGDLLAGRLQNQGRVDMMRAIRAMSRASAELTQANLDQALRDERTALDNLMRAFARSRFILRALTQRERIDLDRRLSGSLNLSAGLSVPAAAAAPPERVPALRRLLAELAALSSGDSAEVRWERAAETSFDLLRAEPASDTLRRLTTSIQEFGRDVQRRRAPESRHRLDSLLNHITSLIASSLPTAPDASSSGRGALEGALRDAIRARSRRP